MEIVAIIPARGGSKRLPGKNIKNLAGKPMIAWTIEAAQQSKACSKIVVSTEDNKVATVAGLWGAEILDRPAELATDEAKSIDVVIHAIQELGLNETDYVLLLQPTSPLRTGDDIRQAVKIMQEENAEAVVSVTEIPKLAYEDIVQRVAQGSILEPVYPEITKVMEKRYMLNGAIYLNKVKSLIEKKTFRPWRKTVAYIMPPERSIDVDTKAEFLMAKALIQGE